MSRFLFSSLLLFLLFSCKKDPTIVDPIDPTPKDTSTQHVIALGKSFVKKNDQAWNVLLRANLYSYQPQSFGLKANVYYANGVRESVYFSDIPCVAGSYTFEKDQNSNWANSIPQASLEWVLDGDQSLGGLNVDTSRAGNFIEVIRYDSIQKTVEGRFEVYLINYGSPNNTIFDLPDSLRFTEGKFHLKLEN
ncbi:MAG: hypothetical protein IT260_13960 [Saprospiraceae bacterium]|nr:hypothetical protein [Saprospiraceae bacterium]